MEQQRIADKQALLAKSNELCVQALLVIKTEPNTSIRLAEAAYISDNSNNLAKTIFITVYNSIFKKSHDIENTREIEIQELIDDIKKENIPELTFKQKRLYGIN